MIEAKNITLILRKINKKSLGLTIPTEVVKQLNLRSGMLATANLIFEKEYFDYKCVRCGFEWSTNVDDIVDECQACGEEKNILKLDNTNNMKGGDIDDR